LSPRIHHLIRHLATQKEPITDSIHLQWSFRVESRCESCVFSDSYAHEQCGNSNSYDLGSVCYNGHIDNLHRALHSYAYAIVTFSESIKSRSFQRDLLGIFHIKVCAREFSTRAFFANHDLGRSISILEIQSKGT
jgi:hypothetical protein